MTPGPEISLDLIDHADTALIRTVDALSEQAWEEPSLLPGWTRAYVVAHLALNAEGLERAVTGVHTGNARTMYDSNDARAADIEDLAARGASALRERLMAATHCLGRALRSSTEADRLATFDRTPGGQVVPVAAVPLMRLREVEVHHVDLDAGYSAHDWSEAFRAVLVESMVQREQPAPFHVEAIDLGRTWATGGAQSDGSPTVSGDSADLGWWLTGRGAGANLSVSHGDLPRIEAW